MILVGELINASRKAIGRAIEARDEQSIRKAAADQAAGGADYIDVNAGVFVDREPEFLKWLVTVVQDETAKPCCIDSPSPAAIEAALSVHQGTAMVNSISLETDRWENLLPLVAGTDLKVVALCMSDDGMPETADQRLAIAERLIDSLVKNGVAPANIHVDPLVQPVSTHNDFGVHFLEAVERIRKEFSGVHTMCGLSNISYGLPERKLLNQVFMAMAIARGLDGAIVNPLDRRMMAVIAAAETLVGNDSYCMNYLKAYRSGALER